MRRLVAVALVALVMAGVAAAAKRPPPAPPKFWSVGRCERVLQHDYVLPTAEGWAFHVRQAICVGTGACARTSDHGARLYSEFTVFGRAHYIGSIVRSWTLATRGSKGFLPIGRPGGDAYAGWPAVFFVPPTSVRLLATSSTAASYRALVAPIAAGLTRQESATGC
jgi:hypothetical protein